MKFHDKHGHHRLIALLLVLALCMSLAPSVFAEQVLYRDPAEHWKKAVNRTNELDVNSVTTTESFYCFVCGQPTAFTVWRTPEYTRDGQTALIRNVKYSDGTLLDGSGTGTILDGVPGVDSTYTGYHWTKACCDTCGTMNSNCGAEDYSCAKNVYWLYDCDANFIEPLDEEVTYEYVDDTYHMVTIDGGNYCAFCYGTKHTHESRLERHALHTDIIPQLGHQRFAIVRHCELCEYTEYEFVAAKSVIADYFGVVDGQPHTLTVSDLSEAGVNTSIRYGNSAENCTLTSAPNYTEEGQYTVYYEITYRYQDAEMTEDGVAYVWLRDDSAADPNNSGCTCGCGRSDCDCRDTGCEDKPCCENSCRNNHRWTLLETVTPTCSQLGYDRYICVKCGLIENRNYVNAIPHAYQTVVIRDATCEVEGKTMDICQNCGDVKETITPKGEHRYRTYNVAPTCTAPGYTVRECSVCGDRHIENITEPAGHNFVVYVTPPTCTTGGNMLHICSVCGDSFIDNYVPATGHSMDNGTVLTPAVCDHDGVMEYTCETCGYTERETIPAIGHAPGPEATCTDPQLCAVCGAVLAQAKGHDIHATVIPATCLEMGHTDFYCVNCDLAYDGDYVNPLGHDYVGVITAPTCTERGYTTFICSRCGDSYIGDYVDATGHFWDDGTVIKDPTCTEDGIIEYRCTVCNVTRLEDYSGEIVGTGHDRSTVVTMPTLSLRSTVVTPAAPAATLQSVSGTATGGGTGHSYVGTVTPANCTERGFTTFVCVTCGDTYVSDFTASLGHNYKAVVTAPTCTELGYTTYTCDRCGDSYVTNYTNALGHSWKAPVVLANNTCSSDGVMEYDCSRCDAHYYEAISAKGHNPGPAATCDTPQVCLDCGAVLAPATRHNYKPTVTAPTCTELGFATYTCANCGDSYKSDYVRELGHSYKKAVTKATCTEGGYTTYTCSRCNDSYVDDYTDPLGHDWLGPELLVSSTCNNDGLLEYKCSRCNDHYHEAVSAAGHRPGPAASCTDDQLCSVCGAVLAPATGHNYQCTVTDPTCTTMGYTTFICSACGDSYQGDYTDTLGHNYQPIVTAPTCIEGGYTTYTCSRCGDSYQGDFTEAKGHRWDNGTVLIASTCDRDGVLQYTCQDCGAQHLEIIPASANASGQTGLTLTNPATQTAALAASSSHNYRPTVTAPTCTDLGYTTYTCQDCGDSYKTDYVNALGHSYRAEVKAPTCTEGGYTTFTCTRCGDSYVGNYTNALGHAWKAPVVLADSTCNGDGVMEYDCSRCDAHYHEAISAKGHNPGPAATCDTPQVCLDCGAVLAPATRHNYKPTVTAPTCTEFGFTTYTCTNCGNSYKSDYVREKGHNYNAVVTAPSCEQGGYTTYTCSVCGDSYVDDYTEALGHDWLGPELLASSTCNTDGLLEYKCSRCNAHYHEAVSATGHTPGHAATCDNPQTCLTCGAVLAEATGHDFKAAVTEATCTDLGYTTYTCANCGESYKSDYVREKGHDYKAAVTAPTCIEGGYTTFTCSRCGDSYQGDFTDAKGHRWDNGTVLIESACDREGVMQYTCQDCGAQRLETIPASGSTTGQTGLTQTNPGSTVTLAATTGHNYQPTVTAPTCTELGYTTYTCADCGTSFKTDYVNVLGHDYRPTVTAPTCTEGGFTTFTCSRCGDSYVTNYTNPLGHDWKTPVMLASNTCNSDGVLDYACSRCDAHRLEAISAKGHNPGPAATCNNPQTCLDCGAVLAPATNHNYQPTVTAPTCTELGYTTYTCANCGDSYKSDYVRETGHHYEASVTAPDCTEGGFTTYVCSGCGDTYVSDYTAPLGHDWIGPELLVDSSCNGDGLLEYNCSRCNVHYHEAVSATGHNPGPAADCINPQTCLDCGAVLAPATGHDYKADVTPATCLKMGYTTYTCANCGDSFKSDYTDPIGHNYEAVVTPPTCTERGYTTYACANCGDSYQDDFTDAKGHRLDDGKILTPGVCDHDGVVQYFCLDCDYMTLETIPATGHVPGPEATCTDPQVCTVCGVILAPAKGHNLQSEVIPASCLDLGHTHYFCEDCGIAYDSDYTLPVGHDYVPEVTEPTCLDAGYTTYTCSCCGDSYISDHVDALGHEWDEGTLIVDASCNGEGVLDHHCVRCDYHYLEALSPTGHTPGAEATCTEPQVCTVCGAVLELAKGHNYQPSVTEPACTTMGFTTYTCSDCGDSYKSDYVEATGHKIGDWIIDKEPTTTADGSKHRECEVCHEKLETERIEKLYLTAITDTKGEATVGEYLVTVTDTDTATPVPGATVTLNSDGSISVRLPDGRLVDYADQTNVTVVKTKDKAAVPSMSIAMTDKNGNTARGATNKNGAVTLPGNTGVTDNDGKATFGYTDSKGNKLTLTVRVLDFESGRPVVGALVGYSGGKVTVRLPDGTDLGDSDKITIVVLDNQRTPVNEQETTASNDIGRSATGNTDTTGTLTVPTTVETERHSAYVNGYPDGTFGPENSMTRSEATAIFARLLAAKNGESIPASGTTKFTDVSSDAWYAGYVVYLTRYGVVNGTSETEFSPNKAITRAEFVTLAVRFFDVYGGGDMEKLGNYVSFNDVPSGYWAAGYIQDAASFGWINGYGDGSFRAGNKITRAEVVTIVNRVLGREADQSYINNARGLTVFSDVVKNHWAYYDIMEAANTHTAVLGKTETWQK